MIRRTWWIKGKMLITRTWWITRNWWIKGDQDPQEDVVDQGD
jgi:hypothetical protein